VSRWADVRVRTVDATDAQLAIGRALGGGTRRVNLVVDFSGQERGHGVVVSLQDHPLTDVLRAVRAAGIEPIAASSRLGEPLKLDQAADQLDGAA
jgi:hypothetical protein